MLLPLHRSLPYCGVHSYRAAGAVLNSDGSDGRAAIGRRSIKEYYSFLIVVCKSVAKIKLSEPRTRNIDF